MAETLDLPRAAATREALQQLSSFLLREHSMDALLQRVVDLTAHVMPVETEASILLMVRGKPTTPVSTGQLALDCDEQQFERREGPCLHAAGTGDITEIPDTRSEDRWRDYTVHAASTGALSSLSVPLTVGGELFGALNIYAREPHAFDAPARAAALEFATYAAIAVANMQTYLDAQAKANNLELALQSRAVIDQAKGILMERFKVTPDTAFQVLTRVSMQQNRKVRVIAEELVASGELPGAVSPL